MLTSTSRYEQVLFCEVNTEQGTDWVTVWWKASCKSLTKTKTAIFKCPACWILHFQIFKIKWHLGWTKRCRHFCARWPMTQFKGSQTERHTMKKSSRFQSWWPKTFVFRLLSVNMWRGTFLTLCSALSYVLTSVVFSWCWKVFLCVAVSCFMWIKVVRLFLFINNQFYDSSDCSTVYTFSARTVVWYNSTVSAKEF